MYVSSSETCVDNQIYLKLLKTRRKRLNPIFRWGENVTKQLLTLTLDEIKRNSSSFEKPTAQKFYEKISANSKSLQMTNWSSMKNKIRNCKVLYIKARKWKKESNKSSNDDEKEIKEDTFDFSEDTETNDNASYNDFKRSDHSNTEESQSNLDESLIQDDDPLTAASFVAPQPDMKIADTQKTAKLKNDRKVCSCRWKFWANIEKSKLEIEQKKLDFEQKKFEWQLEKEEAELELKEKQLKQQFEMRKLELEKEERLEKEKIKLRLEQEERLKKYEMEIKYKIANFYLLYFVINH
uniref:Uncharacterized protein n=1 Tax=Glossina austeni TaxID=7395 RepID=A0A1A9VGD8_GLOAU